MHDLKFIRDNRDLFDKLLKKRNINNSSKRIIDLHDEYLKSLNKTQDFQEKKNILSKKFSPKMSKDEMNNLKNEVLKLKENIEKHKIKSDDKYKELTNHMLEIPNLVDEKTPIGENEEDNKIIRTVGEKKNLILHLKIIWKLEKIYLYSIMKKQLKFLVVDFLC